MTQLVEGSQRSGIELAQCVAELIELPLPGPDQALVRARQDLDGLEQLAVGLDRTMVVAVGAHQIGRHLGVTPVELGAAGDVSLAVPRGGRRIGGVHLVPGGQQRADRQAAIGLDADHRVGRSLDLLGKQTMQHCHPFQPVGDLALHQDPPLGVEHTQVMVLLGPVDAHDDRTRTSSWSTASPISEDAAAN
jgi:hypothetical protein